MRGADGHQLPEREREMEVLEPGGQNNENEKIKDADSKPCGPVGCQIYEGKKKKKIEEECTCVAGNGTVNWS